MEYAKLQGSFLRGAKFKDADMAARGAWATLIAHCADQENGGRIASCKGWADRQWLLRTDCMRADVDHVVRLELASWHDDDLVIDGYDRVAEGAYHALSEVNRKRAIDAHEKRRAGKSNGAAAHANGAGGNHTGSRRHDSDTPAAGESVPPAVENGANQPTNQPTTDRNTGTGAAPPPDRGVPASGSRGERNRARVTEPTHDEVGDKIRRLYAAARLVAEIASADGLALLEHAPDSVRQAHARLIDPTTRANRAQEDIDTLSQWWATMRGKAAS